MTLGTGVRILVTAVTFSCGELTASSKASSSHTMPMCCMRLNIPRVDISIGSGFLLLISYIISLTRYNWNTVAKQGAFVLFNNASRVHWFSYHRPLDIKHLVIVAYFFRGNPLSPDRLLFSISSKWWNTVARAYKNNKINNPVNCFGFESLMLSSDDAGQVN